MERYHIIKEVGRGSYGVVWHAIDLQNYDQVAIKKLTTKHYYSEKECMKLEEVRSLVKLNHHPNIISLKEIVRENNVLFLVFEYMQGSLFDRMANYRKHNLHFSETEIRDLCFQIFQGLAYMHENGYFHRDLKPANLLVYNDVIKIGDLGSAREINDQSRFTHNVTTLWYRAPEVFLHSSYYNSAVDMWAMGAIMAELFTFQPLFQGPSAAEVMRKICSVLGTPTESMLMERKLARNINYRFPEFPGVRFSDLLPSASPDAVNLIAKLLSWQPFSRPTARLALQHPFFNGCYRVPPTIYLDQDTTANAILNSLSFKLKIMTLMHQRELELLKQLMTSHLEICSETEDPKKDDIIQMLPENPFEFM